jgi:hypothetical protein
MANDVLNNEDDRPPAPNIKPNTLNIIKTPTTTNKLEENNEKGSLMENLLPSDHHFNTSTAGASPHIIQPTNAALTDDSNHITQIIVESTSPFAMGANIINRLRRKQMPTRAIPTTIPVAKDINNNTKLIVEDLNGTNKQTQLIANSTQEQTSLAAANDKIQQTLKEIKNTTSTLTNSGIIANDTTITMEDNFVFGSNTIEQRQYDNEYNLHQNKINEIPFQEVKKGSTLASNKYNHHQQTTSPSTISPVRNYYDVLAEPNEDANKQDSMNIEY